jgi:hypothetical protein
MDGLADLSSVATPKQEPRGETALGLLQAIYRDLAQPLSMRVRCAIEALPYENPKLTAIAVGQFGSSFAAMLDLAIERSRSMRLIEAPKATEPEPNNQT